MHAAQRRYVLDLFSVECDHNYINNRLRIGLVHKRIGVEPKLYLSAIYTLKSLLIEVPGNLIEEADKSAHTKNALEKSIYLDITLVFDT